jgi:hypothetical protein
MQKSPDSYKALGHHLFNPADTRLVEEEDDKVVRRIM